MRLFGAASAPATPRRMASGLSSPRSTTSRRSSKSVGLFKGTPPWRFVIKRAEGAGAGAAFVRERWVQPEAAQAPASPRSFGVSPRDFTRSPIHGCTQRRGRHEERGDRREG